MGPKTVRDSFGGEGEAREFEIRHGDMEDIPTTEQAHLGESPHPYRMILVPV